MAGICHKGDDAEGEEQVNLFRHPDFKGTFIAYHEIIDEFIHRTDGSDVDRRFIARPPPELL